MFVFVEFFIYSVCSYVVGIYGIMICGNKSKAVAPLRQQGAENTKHSLVKGSWNT